MGQDLDASPRRARVRLAVISTPRSGNTWLRHLLRRAYAVADFAVHNPDDLDWAGLPEACVVQLHWRRTAAFVDRLRRHDFRVIVLARHPLDVLVSILHFALHDRSTGRWLEGEAGDEQPICGAMPCSAAFARYAAGPRAAALLAVTAEWWGAPGCCCVRYEDLVAEPVGELTRLGEALELPPHMPVTDAVAATTMPRLRTLTQCDHHFWKGQPGHWKRLLPTAVARAIAHAHPGSFAPLGYVCDPDPDLDVERADAHWLDLNRQELTERLWNYVATRQLLQETEGRLEAAAHAAEARAEALGRVQAELAKAQDCIRGLVEECDRLHAHVAANAPDPADLALAQRLGRWKQRHPRLWALARKLWPRRLG